MARNLNSEFVKYYKEKLEPYGFKKVKGRQPYFVRVINDEILHIISLVGTFSTQYGYKAFHLMCGVATVYRKEINFSATPRNNTDWMVALGDLYKIIETEFPVVQLPQKSMKFNYNDENLDEVLEETYEGVQILINELDKVTDMDKVLRYLLKYDAKNVAFWSLLDDSFSDEEGLYYARKEFDYTRVYKIFEETRKDLANSLWSEEEKLRMLPLINEQEERMKTARLNFISNDDDYERGMQLLKAHYNANVDALIKYGLDIQKKELEF